MLLPVNSGLLGAISLLDIGSAHHNFAPGIQKLIWVEKVFDVFEPSEDNYIRIVETHKLKADEVKQEQRKLYLMWGTAATWYMKDCLLGKNSDPEKEALCEKHRNFYKGAPETKSTTFSWDDLYGYLQKIRNRWSSSSSRR